uniref:OTU domain-containing protein n=1 Tax=Homalodisca liturata TaxID=320908 RepID=A0A1B6HY16_9HEMI
MCSRFVSTNKPLREPASRSKIWVKPTDQMDLWLDSQGYYRKHTAKDGSCLYRAVSEQIFLAQAFHLDVRRQCAEYAHRHPELLSSVTHCTVDEYVDHMKHPHELGGKVELQVMSLMFRRDFLVFYEVGKNFQQATDNGFKDRIMLCLSQDRHYDSVYTKQFISNAAFCQSLIYETLYKGVFELLEVDYAVKKMLHDKSSKYQRDSSSFLMNGLALRLEIRDSYFNVKDLLTLGVTPFPYKVAKSLDPDIYRNVEYDTWNDIRRGLRYGMYMWNNRELQVGVKCLVKLQPDRVCHAHIQDMAPNKGPVVVFVEELGEKVTVDYESLELLPQPPQPPSLPLPLKQLRQLQTIKALTHDMLPHEDIGEKDVCTESLTVSNSDKDDVWRIVPESDGKAAPKLKMFAELSKPSKRSSKAFRTKTKDLQLHSSSDSVKNQAEANSVVSSSDCNYQQQDVLNYQQESYEEYNSQGYMQQDVNIQAADEEMEQKGTEVDSSTPPTVLCLEPQHYYIPSTETYPHPTYCYVPHKPEDIAPLRFYYNYGVDHYSRGIRPTPPCYLNTTVAYMPDPNISPGIYEHASTPGLFLT